MCAQRMVTVSRSRAHRSGKEGISSKGAQQNRTIKTNLQVRTLAVGVLVCNEDGTVPLCSPSQHPLRTV